MEEALRSRVRSDAAITAEVGTRVDWLRRPTGSAGNAITLSKISPGREYGLDGADALQGPRIRFDIWGRQPGDARVIARLVIAMMEQEATVGGVRFSPAFLAADRDLPSEDAVAAGIVDRVQLEFFVWNQPV